jgi:formate dehydrogenase subunit gamma
MSPHVLNPHVLKMCRAEFCQSMDCEKTIQHVENRLGVKLGQTTDDGSFTLEAAYCLGWCAHSPSVMLDGNLYGPVSPQLADLLIDSALVNSELARENSP